MVIDAFGLEINILIALMLIALFATCNFFKDVFEFGVHRTSFLTEYSQAAS